jgi:hypothetical protein
MKREPILGMFFDASIGGMWCPSECFGKMKREPHLGNVFAASMGGSVVPSECLNDSSMIEWPKVSSALAIREAFLSRVRLV